MDKLIEMGWEVFERFFPDPADAAKAKLEYDKLMVRMAEGQMAVNQAEASHASLFVSGWRPFVGWVCAIALAWHFMGMPILQWALLLIMNNPPEPPKMDLFELITILTGMLGLGGIRMTEKVKGVARNNMKATSSVAQPLPENTSFSNLLGD
ncbi:MAG: hypothetical protein COB24_11890 [Hyphomicrobiales bacterium]|nr:MAG: hypothetical protein COB24_11890 [Hyphomicrobiales bacterium]